MLVDSDPQGSARDWSAARESKPPFSLVAIDRPTVHRDLPEMAVALLLKPWGRGYSTLLSRFLLTLCG